MEKRNFCISCLFILYLSVAPAIHAQSTDLQQDKTAKQELEQSACHVRHLIMWTLNKDVSQEKKDSIVAELKNDFKRLRENIPGVLQLDLLYEGRLESSNCDFMFDFLFESEEALKSFSTNPEHLKSAGKLKPYIAGRTCLDISTH